MPYSFHLYHIRMSKKKFFFFFYFICCTWSQSVPPLFLSSSSVNEGFVTFSNCDSSDGDGQNLVFLQLCLYCNITFTAYLSIILSQHIHYGTRALFSFFFFFLFLWLYFCLHLHMALEAAPHFIQVTSATPHLRLCTNWNQIF